MVVVLLVIKLNRNTLFLFLSCVLVFCMLPYFGEQQAQPVAAKTGNADWGLYFRELGKQPKGNASSEYLKKFNACYIGEPDEKVIYLTFDAGFENGYTPRILDALKKHNVKAAFFLVGHYLNRNPEIVKRMETEGHIVGNHTYHHPDMSKIQDFESFKKELGLLEESYKSITGKEMPKYYRPPSGMFSESNLKHASELGYKTVFWSLAYRDWYTDSQPSREEAFNRLMPRMHSGAVVLLHSTSKTNSEILDELLTKLKQEGYSFGTLDELTA